MPSEIELSGLIERARQVAADAAERAGDGEAVASAALLASGRVHVGVWVAAAVDSACLCAETGPICEAHASCDPIIAIACVSHSFAGARVLPACGVCQERLQVFGEEVLIAVASEPTVFRALADLRPWSWWQAARS